MKFKDWTHTGMDSELSLAGYGAGEVLGSAGVDPRILWLRVEHYQRALVIIVHKGKMATLR